MLVAKVLGEVPRVVAESAPIAQDPDVLVATPEADERSRGQPPGASGGLAQHAGAPAGAPARLIVRDDHVRPMPPRAVATRAAVA
jgi:hypothetical protein